MTFAPFPADQISLRTDRVPIDDALRQERTAAQLLQRLTRQPGVVLADEVGMGKTFVALAVAASILIDRPKGGPVVVMVPPSLRHKWPKDWKVFREKCLSGPAQTWLRHATANSGVEFLKLLDDPLDRRAHILFLTHGALHRALEDGFIKLAVLKRAFKGRGTLRAQRRNFPRFAGRLLRMESGFERRAPGLLGELLETPYENWLATIHRAHDTFCEKYPDDPVPKHVRDVLEEMSADELQPLVDELRGLPLRESTYIEERLVLLRSELSRLLRGLWKETLKRADFASPLVILDEAHHLKNPQTRLASLFVDESAAEESECFDSNGALGGKFERMLFLTATPFQLGHAELLNVLRRFEGIRWNGPHRPTLTRDAIRGELTQLEESLDESQATALRFEKVWARLNVEHLVTEANSETEGSDVDAWWSRVRHTPSAGLEEQVVQLADKTAAAMRKAESHLRPWVLRHLKSKTLSGAAETPRRIEHPGAAIHDEQLSHTGLAIVGDALLPFLLAGRAQSLLAMSDRGRAFFAEGLASSFEAYLETRSGKEDRDIEELDLNTDNSEDGNQSAAREVDWYLQHLDAALNDGGSRGRLIHPKIQATVAAAVRLWQAGEKLLIFSHYRATGRALRDHISAKLHERIIDRGHQQLTDLPRAKVAKALEDIGDRFFDRDGSLRQEVDESLSRIVVARTNLPEEDRQQVVAICRRFLRTPSFLVRYFDLTRSDRAAAFVEAIERDDLGGQSLRHRIEHFCEFLTGLIPEERTEYLESLRRLQPGSHIGREARNTFESTELTGHPTTTRLPNVRLANGTIAEETRRRLLLAFNTPLFPEILIASSVLAEGVDLHLNCRHVIHHDLCWNPSTLEQRTGRIDRLGSKAEQVHRSIDVFLPYVAATQDEKMYRVVQDRDRWFQIVLGETYTADELTTDRESRRLPLPNAVQEALSLRLDRS